MPELTDSRLFILQFGLGVVAGLLILAWHAARRDIERVGAWLDAAIGALVGATIVGRIVHILLEWEYFREYPTESWRVWYGGISWHGALIGALVGAFIICKIRNLSFLEFSDGLALAMPLVLMSGWWACRRVGGGFGVAIETTEEVPTWFVGFLPDINGNIEPRLELQIFAVWVSFGLFVIMALLTLKNWLPHVRLWILLYLTGVGMFISGFFRGGDPDLVLGRRLEQNFDAVLMILSAAIGFGIFLRWRLPMIRTLEQPEIQADG